MSEGAGTPFQLLSPLAQPPSQITLGVAFPARSAPPRERAAISNLFPHLSGARGPQRDNISPQGHVFANFVTAFIKWGFTGALSSISGLVGELNKTVWDAGLLWRRYLFREEWSLRSLPCAGKAGRAAKPLEGLPHSSSRGSGAQTGNSEMQTGSGREPGSLEDRPVGLSGEGSDGTLDSV